MATADEELGGIGNAALRQDEEPDTLLAALAQKRRAVQEATSVDIRVPGYDQEPPILYATYRHLDGKELEIIGQSIMRTFKSRTDRELYSIVDTFTRAISGFKVDLGDGELNPLTYKGAPITGFTSDLAAALQFADKITDPDDARQVVFGLFVHDVPIFDHGVKLNRWFANTSVDVNAAFMGNL
jgi:hypothetical protein